MNRLFKTFFLILFLAFLYIPHSVGRENSKFYIEGQVHPVYSIKIFINGNMVKEYFNDNEELKMFLFEIDKEKINEGENNLKVIYTVKREVKSDIPSSRSFRFNIRYQPDPMNSSSSVKMYKARGPKEPFPSVGTSQTLTDTFVFKK